ncbi:hypothetical protein WHI96_19605 [Pseudonocardia tropica]|uniref:Polymerase nucleotidyl transferase domain-containing protein n=1 Tax=Pseudonocardia tropica TaxID=681289 RepID=A0ABV1JYK6_9PSEU
MLPELVVSEDDEQQFVLPWSEEPWPATWQEVERTFRTTDHRRSLLSLASSRLFELQAAGIPIYAAWINGSFVTAREHPNDIDVVVLIDGDRSAASREATGLSPAAWLDATHVLRNARYERGGTAADHRSDFRFVTFYAEEARWTATAQDELDHWFTVWSRLEVGPRDRSGRGKMVEDAKGFVEVRW